MNTFDLIICCNDRASFSESGWDPDQAASAVTFSSEDDYEIATCIRTSIIPASVTWYTGEATQDDFCRELEDQHGDEGVFALVSPARDISTVCGESETVLKSLEDGELQRRTF